MGRPEQWQPLPRTRLQPSMCTRGGWPGGAAATGGLPLIYALSPGRWGSRSGGNRCHVPLGSSSHSSCQPYVGQPMPSPLVGPCTSQPMHSSAMPSALVLPHSCCQPHVGEPKATSWYLATCTSGPRQWAADRSHQLAPCHVYQSVSCHAQLWAPPIGCHIKWASTPVPPVGCQPGPLGFGSPPVTGSLGQTGPDTQMVPNLATHWSDSSGKGPTDARCE